MSFFFKKLLYLRVLQEAQDYRIFRISKICVRVVLKVKLYQVFALED